MKGEQRVVIITDPQTGQIVRAATNIGRKVQVVVAPRVNAAVEELLKDLPFDIQQQTEVVKGQLITEDPEVAHLVTPEQKRVVDEYEAQGYESIGWSEDINDETGKFDVIDFALVRDGMPPGSYIHVNYKGEVENIH